MDEAEQIIRARQGDETAWLALVRQHQTVIFRFVYLLMGDADDADDVVQETFIRAYHALERFDLTRPLRPWLLQIAKNLAANRRRSMRRYLAALSRWWQAFPPLETMEQHQTQQLAAEQLWQAIRCLKVTEQEVIYLRYFLDLSVTETAVTLDIAEGTVKSRLARSLAHLRVIVEQDFPALREEVVT